jgi:hypothetical protein
MKRILVSLMVIALISGLIGSGIYATFSDLETSSGNQFISGTLDLKLSDANETDQDGVTGSIGATGMKPDDTGTVSGWIKVKNSGSLSGTLTLTITLSEPTEPAEPTDPGLNTELTAAQFADGVIATTLTYDTTTDLLASVTDDDADGKDLKEIADDIVSYDLGTLGGGVEKQLDMTVYLDDACNNDFQADGVEVTFTFTLAQA